MLAITSYILPHNFHFLTESVARDVLVEDYTRTQLQSALGSSIDYSVQGATIVSPTASPPGLVGLSDAGITVATVIMTLNYFCWRDWLSHCTHCEVSTLYMQIVFWDEIIYSIYLVATL